MRDQAERLRQLVHAVGSDAPSAESVMLPLVVVAGGKGGVGATTVAVNLAVTLGRRHQRVVLVDANFQQPDTALLCGLEPHQSLADVLSGRRTVPEVLQPGPAGIRVLPGAWGSEVTTDCTPAAQQRLLAELDRLASQVDCLVLDVGSGRDASVQRFWQTAAMVLLVTTPDSIAVLDAYAAVKMIGSGDRSGRICTVLNQVAPDTAGTDVHGRMARTCRRFLGMSIQQGPSIPSDPAAVAAVQNGRPLVLATPSAPAASAIEELAGQVGVALKSQPFISRARPRNGGKASCHLPESLSLSSTPKGERPW